MLILKPILITRVYEHLIKPTAEKIFNIDGLRYTNYQSSLRIESSKEDIKNISTSINDTMNNSEDINSLLELPRVKEAAKLAQAIKMDGNTALIIRELGNIAKKLNSIENNHIDTDYIENLPEKGWYIFDNNNVEIGKITKVDEKKILYINSEDHSTEIIYRKDFDNMSYTSAPF